MKNAIFSECNTSGGQITLHEKFQKFSITTRKMVFNPNNIVVLKKLTVWIGDVPIVSLFLTHSIAGNGCSDI